MFPFGDGAAVDGFAGVDYRAGAVVNELESGERVAGVGFDARAIGPVPRRR